MTIRIKAILLALAAVFGVGAAHADTCVGMTADCDAGGATDICVDLTGPGTIECDLAKNGGNYAADPVFVIEDSGDYQVWGTAGNGNDFCCVLTAPTSDYVFEITGTDNDDDIRLNYLGGVYNLAPAHGGYWLYPHLYGGDGDDKLHGSFSTSGVYTETLYGQGDDDFMRGWDGSDVLHGGPGADDLGGGAGHDTLCGGGGGDTNLDGDAGDDTIWVELVSTEYTCNLNVNCGGNTDAYQRDPTSGPGCSPPATFPACENVIAWMDAPLVCQYPDGP